MCKRVKGLEHSMVLICSGTSGPFLFFNYLFYISFFCFVLFLVLFFSFEVLFVKWEVPFLVPCVFLHQDPYSFNVFRVV